MALHPVSVCHNTHAFDERREHFHTDSAYAFVTNEEPKNPAGEGESELIRYVTRDELASMSGTETYKNIVNVGLFIFDTCLPRWERVNPSDFTV